MKIPAETRSNPGGTLPLIEAAVLGACLAAPWQFPKVAEVLTPDDFSDRANRETYIALLAMHGRGVPPDSVLLTVELRDSKKRSVVETVRGLLQVPVVAAHLQFYLEALLQRSKSRQKAISLLESATGIGEDFNR
jgi:replicative DNA helicase